MNAGISELYQALRTMSPADWGRTLSLPISGLILWLTFRLVGWLVMRKKPRPRPANAIDSTNYRCPPHQHVIDMDRSPLMPLEGGAVLAQCCMQGCDVTVTIGRGVTELLIEEEVALER